MFDRSEIDRRHREGGGEWGRSRRVRDGLGGGAVGGGREVMKDGET